MSEKDSNERALATRRQFEEYLKAQLALPWQKQRELIQSTMPLREDGVKKAVMMAKAYQLPLDTIAMIPSGKRGLQPYVMERGINFRLQMDPRGLQSIETEILHWATREEPYARVRCTIKFRDGSTFVAHASHSAASESNPNWTPDFITMKAETKARRRAGIAAVGIPFPVWESEMEYREWEAQRALAETVEGEARPIDELEGPQFLAQAFAVGWTYDQVLERLGVSKFAEIKEKYGSYEAALEALGAPDNSEQKASGNTPEDSHEVVNSEGA